MCVFGIGALCVVADAVLFAVSTLCVYVSLVAGVASVCSFAAGILCAPGRSFCECVSLALVLCVLSSKSIRGLVRIRSSGDLELRTNYIGFAFWFWSGKVVHTHRHRRRS